MAAFGQQPAVVLSFSNDPCGNPLEVSQQYIGQKGRLLKVLSGDTLLIRFPGHGVKTVHLACLRAPRPSESGFEASRKALTELIGGKTEVEVDLASISNLNRKSLTAMVEMSVWSKAQLEAGMACFAPVTNYEMSSYEECHCRLAEKKAKEAGIGIWRGRTAN